MNFRHDELLVYIIACLLVDLGGQLIGFLEQKKLVPCSLSFARERFRTNRKLWLVTVFPTMLFSIFITWLCMRTLLPDSLLVSRAIVAVILSFSIGSAVIRYLTLRKESKKLRAIAVSHLQSLENNLEELVHGPVIEDPELDQRILQIKQKLYEARESLGIRKEDARDK